MKCVKGIRERRAGITSVLAMLFLVLFTTMAVGFYAATNTQTQIVNNDERAARAQLAAESGMDFMRYQLGRVYIPPEPLPPDQVIVELHSDLKELLDGTTNMGGQSITLAGNTIHIPANGGSIVGEHGVGTTRRPFMDRTRSPEEIALMQRLKRAFDPKNLLNPGKVVVLEG